MDHPTLAAQFAMGTVFALLATIGFFGNVLVCIAIYANKKLRKKENLYFVSLSIADLLVALLIMPFAASNDVLGRWLFGEYCKFWMSLDIMLCTASNLHLCAISFDRYYHIHDPMRYRERMSIRKILLAIGAVWTLSIIIAFTPLFFDETQFEHTLVQIQQNSTLINFQRCRFTLDPLYAVVSSMVSFYLPCLIMILAYAQLYKYAQRHALTIWHQLQTMTTFLVNVASHGALVEETRSNKWTKRRKIGPLRGDRKARVTLGAIMGAFIGAWLPFFVCNIARAFCGVVCVPNWLFVTFTWMGYANSSQNPILYSIFNRDFRRAFRRTLGLEKKCFSIVRRTKKRKAMEAERERLAPVLASVEKETQKMKPVPVVVKVRHQWRSI